MHFNDGEINSLNRTDGRTDRGYQARSPALAAALAAALQADAHGLYIGIPCRREFPFLHQRAARLVHGGGGMSASLLVRTRVTAASVFINGNFATARALLPRILLARAAHVHLVVSATADIDRFTNCTGLRPTRVERIAPMDAFPLDYERLKQGWQAVAGGDVVIFCAGPLGRLLAIAWHARQPAATYLELGSFFDPDLAPPERAFFRRRGRNRGARYYPQVQCGVRVNESLYVARTHHPGCQTVRDVRAAIDEAAIWRALKRAP